MSRKSPRLRSVPHQYQTREIIMNRNVSGNFHYKKTAEAKSHGGFYVRLPNGYLLQHNLDCHFFNRFRRLLRYVRLIPVFRENIETLLPGSLCIISSVLPTG